MSRGEGSESQPTKLLLTRLEGALGRDLLSVTGAVVLFSSCFENDFFSR